MLLKNTSNYRRIHKLTLQRIWQSFDGYWSFLRSNLCDIAIPSILADRPYYEIRRLLTLDGTFACGGGRLSFCRLARIYDATISLPFGIHHQNEYPTNCPWVMHRIPCITFEVVSLTLTAVRMLTRCTSIFRLGVCSSLWCLLQLIVHLLYES